MMESSTFWEDSANGHQHVKYESYLNARGGESSQACKEEQGAYRYCEGNLNFATVATSEDDEYSSYHKKKISRDPMSHRIIEKRRRDRMNNCLADLSRLIPTDYLKKGRGRIEKTEIIEMAIKHMKHLQTHACRQLDSCDLPQQDLNRPEDQNSQHPAGGPIVIEHYRLGYQECLSETMHFLVEVEGFFAGDPLCVQLINHLQKHCDKILKGDRLNFPRAHNGETTSMSSNSSGYNNHHTSTGVSSGSPTSGSNSDSGRTEQKDSHAPSQSVAASHTDSNYFADISEEGCCEDGFINLTGPSQLREMLTSSNLATLQTSQTLTDLSRNSQMSHEEPVNTDHACASGGSTASLYKFKNNIKQRFTAEHHTHTVASNSVSGAKRKRFSNDQAQDLPMCRDSETCSIQSSPTPPLVSKYPPHSPSPDLSCSPPPPPLSKSANPSFGVPIFALHAKGSFYIPLTLDAHVLAPYLSAIGFGSDVSTFQNSIAVSDSMVLHPVTISVNFQLTNHHRLPNQQPLKQHSSVPSWKNELSGFPKWSVYSPDRN